MQNDKRVREITPDSLIDFWSSIINNLQENGIPFKILTNGGDADYNMALRLVERLDIDRECLLPLARMPEELVSQLSQFKYVVAHRLHACIISTSLHIPIIPVVWSDKIQVFANMINNKYAVWPSKDAKVDVKNLSIDLERIKALKNESRNFICTSIQ